LEHKKVGRKEGRRVQKRLKLCVNSKARDRPKHCVSLTKL